MRKPYNHSEAASARQGSSVETLIIPDRSKYALLAVQIDHLKVDQSSQARLGADLRVLVQLPLDIPSYWQEWIGTIHADEIKKSNLFVLIVRNSKTPEVQDDEDIALDEELNRFNFALLMSVPYIGHPPATMMSGARYKNSIEVKHVQKYERVFCAAGCRGLPLDRGCLADTQVVAAGIGQLQGRGEHSRTWRITHAFYAGLKEQEPGNRVHEFIRCIEGFVLPEIGKTRRQLVNRSKLFVGPSLESVIGHLFDIRSAVEHLHGPLNVVTGADDREKQLLLLRRAYEAEAIARYCIHRLFSRSQLWPYFRDDAELKRFWTLDDNDKQTLWGDPLDFGSVSQRYDNRWASIKLDT